MKKMKILTDEMKNQQTSIQNNKTPKTDRGGFIMNAYS